MAQLDPGGKVRPLIRARSRYELKIHDLDPEDLIPLGDRYIVEQIDIDETVLAFANILVMTQAMGQKPGDPMADPTVEQRGVIAAIVVTAGNGHLLGLPDPRVVLDSYEMPDAEDGQRIHAARKVTTVERVPADVPMFLSPGTLVFVDHNAKGRALKILGRECRVVNQIDCLLYHRSLRFRRSEDGSWEREE